MKRPIARMIGEPKPIDIDKLSIEEQALFEILCEAADRAEDEGTDVLPMNMHDWAANVKAKQGVMSKRRATRA